jgi:hypothetical protein
MKKYENVFMIISIVLLVLPMVSAFEFDDVKRYDSETKELRIVNAFGFGTDLVRAKLETPQEVIVLPGWQKVATIQAEVYDKDKLVESIKFYDYNDRGKLIASNYEVKYRKENGNLIIDLWATVEPGAKVEWIPTIYGYEVTEWAVFVGATKREWFESQHETHNTVADSIHAQTFTIGTVGTDENFELVGVSINGSITLAPTTLNIHVCNINASGQPLCSGADMLSENTTTDISAWGPGWHNITMPSVVLSASTQYALVVNSTYGTHTGTFKWSRNSTAGDVGDYTGGHGDHISANNGTTWTTFSGSVFDMLFQVWGNAALIVNLDTPFNNTIVLKDNQNFTANYTASSGYIMKNSSYYFWWRSNGTRFNQTNVTVLPERNETEINLTSISLGNFLWNVYACADNGASTECSFADNNRTFTVGANVTDSLYNSTTYETATENYRINLTNPFAAPTTPKLWYNGTEYDATVTAISGDDYYLSHNLNMPTSVGNNTFFFKWNTGTTEEQSTNYSQIVNQTLFGLCNATVNIPFINFTFQNENGTAMNGTIDSSTWTYYLGDGTVDKDTLYSYINNNTYPFCFSPPDKTMHHETNLQYSYSGFPQRRWEYSTDLTNTTLHQTLYLLASADGLYSTYQVQTAQGAPLEDVSVTAEREISGVWTTMEFGETGGDGAVTFWLNPDYDHRLTFTLTGYTTEQVTIRPSSTTYTVTLGSVTGDVFNSSLEGIKYWYTPPSGRLAKDTNYTFILNVTDSNENLDSCRLQILNQDNTIISSTTGCSDTGGQIELEQNTSCCEKMFGRFSLDTGEGYFVIDSDAYWITNITDYSSDGTLWDGINRLRNIPEFGGESGRVEFSRITFFFLILVVLYSALSFMTGWDFATPGGVLLVLTGIVWFASFTGFLDLSGLTQWDFIDKYIVAFTLSLFTIGWSLRQVTKN